LTERKRRARRSRIASRSFSAVDESFDVGSDTGASVEDKDYQVPFVFNGELNKITIKLEPVQMSPEDQKVVQDKNGKRD